MDDALLGRLSWEQWSSSEVAHALGLSAGTFQQRIQERRLPPFAQGRTGAGGRRVFWLLEIYHLRLMEAVIRGGGCSVFDAAAIVARIIEHTPKPSRPIDPLHANEWHREWRHRDLTDPLYLIIGRDKVRGWRTAGPSGGSQSLDDFLWQLGGPSELAIGPLSPSAPAGNADNKPPEPACVIVINFTRELHAVDQEMLAQRPDWQSS